MDEGRLIGYINLIEEETEVFFGIGVNPNFCDQGYGQQMSKKAFSTSNRFNKFQFAEIPAEQMLS